MNGPCGSYPAPNPGRSTAHARGRLALPSALLALLLTAPAGPATAALQISGASDAQAANIRLLTSLADLDCAAPAWLVRLRYRQLDADVRRALEGLGHYNASWEHTLTFSEECWDVELAVVAGPPLVVREITFTVSGDAEDDTNLTSLASSSGLAPAQTFSHAAYGNLKRAVTARAAERGYFDGEFLRAAIDVHVAENAADIELAYDSGRRYPYGELTLSQDLLNEDLVLRYAQWVPGEPYTASGLAALSDRLQSSGYFDQVIVEPIVPDAYGPVDVVAKLDGHGRATYSVGAGYSTDIGPRLRSGYEDRRVNARGHQLSGDLTVSPVLSEISATYRRPLADPTIEWLSYNVGFQAEDTDTAEAESITAGLRRVRRLGGGWLRTDSFRLVVEDYTVGSVTDRARLVLPGVAFGRERSDDPINPSNGYRLSLTARGTSEALGSSTEFVQLLADAKWVRSLGSGYRVLTRLGLGVTFEQDFSELPPSVRFFAGGNESVRGFGFETLGPTDEDGVVIGGSQLATASVEVDRNVYRSVALAAFVDAGNAFDGDNIEARVAAGLGVKWRSPVGPLRLYVARPLNFDERDLRIHISLGPDL